MKRATYNTQLHDMCSLPYDHRVIKRKMRWVRNVARTDKVHNFNPKNFKETHHLNNLATDAILKSQAMERIELA